MTSSFIESQHTRLNLKAQEVAENVLGNCWYVTETKHAAEDCSLNAIKVQFGIYDKDHVGISSSELCCIKKE